MLFFGARYTIFTYTKKAFQQAEQESPFDVVIVPGIPYVHGKESKVMKMRVLWAKHLYDQGITRNIIFSGSSVYTPYAEGIIMKSMADSLGIPSINTFPETEAEHSTENLYYGWKLAKEKGFKKIGLATDPFQSLMLNRFRKRNFPEVQPIPIVFDLLDLSGKQLPEVNIKEAHNDGFVSIKERETFCQRMRGTLGKKVERELKK